MGLLIQINEVACSQSAIREVIFLRPKLKAKLIAPIAERLGVGVGRDVSL